MGNTRVLERMWVEIIAVGWLIAVIAVWLLLYSYGEQNAENATGG